MSNFVALVYYATIEFIYDSGQKKNWGPENKAAKSDVKSKFSKAIICLPVFFCIQLMVYQCVEHTSLMVPTFSCTVFP